MPEHTAPATTGLPGFAFAPSGTTAAQAAAFSPALRALAWLLSAGLLAWMLRLQLPLRQGLTVWAWAAWAMMVWTCWTLQTSRLRLSAQAIEQDWIWRRRIALQELASLRLLRVRGFEWLLAPRLYARSLQGSLVVFYCADPAVLDELERMARELRLWQQGQLQR